MERELLLKAFENVDSKYLHKFSNVDRFADACVRYILWDRGYFKNSEHDREERLAHYWARIERYGGYLIETVKDGTPLEDIIKGVETVLGYLPNFVKDIIVDFIKDYLKGLLGSILKGK